MAQNMRTMASSRLMRRGTLSLIAAIAVLFCSTLHAQNASDSTIAVQRMYVAYYGRPADPDGLGFWVDQLQQSNGDLAQIIDAFGNSAEYNDRLGTFEAATLVNTIYQQAFDRDADEEGLAFYSSQLSAGTMTPASIALNVLDGVRAGSQDYAVVQSKLRIADEFTERASADNWRYDSSNLDEARLLISLLDGSTKTESAIRGQIALFSGSEPAQSQLSQRQLASRFLSQATLGADYETISEVANQGQSAWLEAQFQTRPSYLLTVVNTLFEDIFEPAEQELEEKLEGVPDEDITDDDLIIEDCFELNGQEVCGELEPYYISFLKDAAYFTQVINGNDLLRHRIATALTEIFVVNRIPDELEDEPFLLASYYDMLMRNSFGNFRDLLYDVSLHPAMGIFLSHANNEKSDPSIGRFPDENYAREVMQLFSIGLHMLNSDGSLILDEQGQPIPTYDNDDIREYAKIFTGLTFGGPAPLFYSGNPEDIEELELEREIDWTLPMVMFDEFHEPGEKRLLRGVNVPAGQSGLEDVDVAVDSLFNHPNVGPFIGKQLIQRLVTSNPSPAYVARVAAAFDGQNGNPRGDMKAVIRAILLDEEARTPPDLASSTAGRLREPMLRHLHLVRAFNVNSDTGYLLHTPYVGEEIGQFIFNAPSVFNFFQPTYAPNGPVKDAGLVAPEFQITTTTTIVGLTNQVDVMLFDEYFLDIEEFELFGEARADFSDEVALATNIDALLDRLDLILTYGTLTDETREAVKNAVAEIDADDPWERVYRAIYLIATSPDYAIAI